MPWSHDTLDMAGDWKLIYGYITPGNPGLSTEGTSHYIPTQPRREFVVHFDLEGPGPHGSKYKGFYKDEQFQGHTLSQPGALVAETFYANLGVIAVQLIERSDPDQYFALLSGFHVFPNDDPERTEVIGGWTDIGGHVANFTLVKIADPT